MAKQCATTTASHGSNVYFSFDGLAELLQGPLVATLHQPIPAPAAPVPEKQPIDVLKWPKMDLLTFCERFKIPGGLCDKLLSLGIQGPHVL